MTSTRRPIAVPETLIARARRGDQASFDAMFAAYQPFLLRHLRMVCGTKADDVAAATWESVAGSLDRFRGDGHDFRRWLFTIARRRLVDDLRRDARRPLEAVSLDSVAEPAVAPDTSIEGADWISVRNLDGEIELLNGNQTMVLMTKFLLDQHQKNGFKGNEFIATTIVSTPMMEQMAKAYGVEFKTALTGFKWIGKMIKDFPNATFVGGGEESFGYMVGDFVRDKDAVTSTLLACEVASQAKANGSSFYSELIKCYEQFGFYKEKLISLTKKGISGAEEIKQMLKDFKENPVEKVQGSKVIWIEDYNTSIAKNVVTGEEKSIDLPKSNVLIYETEDGTRVAARPSGTEPKVKFYISTNTALKDAADFKSVNSQLDTKLEGIVEELNLG